MYHSSRLRALIDKTEVSTHSFFLYHNFYSNKCFELLIKGSIADTNVLSRSLVWSEKTHSTLVAERSLWRGQEIRLDEMDSFRSLHQQPTLWKPLQTPQLKRQESLRSWVTCSKLTDCAAPQRSLEGITESFPNRSSSCLLVLTSSQQNYWVTEIKLFSSLLVPLISLPVLLGTVIVMTRILVLILTITISITLIRKQTNIWSYLTYVLWYGCIETKFIEYQSH